ncbi:hypothetical protein ACIBL3_12535 [Kribbella sp. NPDC050124]|uniref:hypothetical protein n=1 Tax=Kribbella sp. NPDC050124 TaxID=3364114 RepID=UPI0037A8C186
MGSIWETRFSNHPLWALINQITGELKSIALPDDGDLADSLSRLQWLVETIDAHRQEDPRRYSTHMLDNVHIHIAANVHPHLSRYARDPDGCARSLRTAADGIDTVLEQLGIWPPLSPNGATGSATMTEYTRELEEIKDSLELQVSAVTDNYRANLDELEETLLTAVLGASRNLASLEEMRGQGENVLTALTRQVVADGYGKNARNKAFAGWTWDLLGLAVGGVPLVMLLAQYFSSDSNILSSTTITVTGLGITLAAVALAWLCFTRGSINHRESRRAKRADLRLRTVHAFIANQPEEVREAVLEGMANRIYLQGNLESNDDSGAREGTDLATYLARARSRRQADDYVAREN